MANYKVQVATGQRGVAIIRNVVASEGDQLVLTDAQHSAVASLIGQGVLIDLGTTTDMPTIPLAAGETALAALSLLGTASSLNTGTTPGTVPVLGSDGTLPMARLGSGTPDGTKYLRDDGTLVTPPAPAPPFDRQLLLSPGGASYDTFRRDSGDATNQAFPVSGLGRIVIFPIAIKAGFTVRSITVLSGNVGASGQTHCWFGLYDKDLVQLATTADALTSTWASFTAKTLAVAATAAGAVSEFTTTYSGIHYLGVLVAASTTPNFLGVATGGTLTGIPPILYAGAGPASAVVTPFPFPITLASAGYGGPLPYAYVSG